MPLFTTVANGFGVTYVRDVFEDNTFEAKATAKAKASTFRGQDQFCEDTNNIRCINTVSTVTKLQVAVALKKR